MFKDVFQSLILAPDFSDSTRVVPENIHTPPMGEFGLNPHSPPPWKCQF